MRAALVQGGIDLNCGALYKTNLFSSLQRGAVGKPDVDRAARRLYRTHFRLGLLDDPTSQPLNRVPPTAVDSAASRAVALRAAREAIVLLRNDAGLLPLSPKASVKHASHSLCISRVSPTACRLSRPRPRSPSRPPARGIQ